MKATSCDLKKALIVVIANCLLLFSPTILAEITLHDVIESVLEDSLEIAISQKSITIREASLQQNKGQFDWQVVGSTGITRQYVPSTRADGTVTTGTTRTNVFNTNIGLRKQFQNGVSINPSVEYFNVADDTPDSLTQTKSMAHFYVNVPMMRGRGTNVVTAGIRTSELRLEASKHQHAHVIARTLADTVQVFWNSLAARDNLDTEIDAEKHAAKLSDSLEQLSLSGEISPVTYQSTQADLLLRRQDINRAKKLLEHSKRKLILKMNRDLSLRGNPVILYGKFPAFPVGLDSVTLNDSELIQSALNNRDDLIALKLQLEAEIISSHAAENNLLPDVDLSFDIDRVFITYEKTFGNNSAKGIVHRNKALIDKYRFQIRSLEKSIENDVLQAVDNIRSALDNYIHAVPSVELYQAMNKITMQKIKLGEATHSEYTVLQDKLAQAKRRLIAAQRDYSNGIVMLRLATGTVGNGEGVGVAGIIERLYSL